MGVPPRSPAFIFVGLSILFLSAALSGFVPTTKSADPSSPTIFTWQPRSDALIDRVEGVGAVVDGKLYVFSGFKDPQLRTAAQVDRYDPTTDSWATVGEMPVLTTHFNPVVDGQTVWFVGGFVGDHPGPPTTNTWKYHVPTNIWEPGPPLPAARASGSLARCGRYLYYFGGFLEDRDTTVADHWRLNLDDPNALWETRTMLPEPRGHLSSVTIGNDIYAIGGQIRHDRDPIDLTSLYRYDTTSDSWVVLADLPTPRSHAEPGTFVYRGRIVLVGGRNSTILRPSELNSIVMYDPPTDTWLALPKLPFTRLAPIAQPFGNEIIVTNGGEWWNNPKRVTLAGVLDRTWELGHPTAPISLSETVGGIIDHRLLLVSNATSATLAFDLSTGSWITETLATRPFATQGHTADAVEGKLYLFGGTDEAISKVQIYDSALNSWSLGADMPFAATNSAATRIGDWIYVSGGKTASIHTNAFARYSISNGNWEPLPPLPMAVVDAAAASDGNRLFLFGGHHEQGSSDVVQAYDPASETWSISTNPTAGLAALPQPRSRAGRAIFLGGEFYLIGGVGADGTPIATMDVYNPITSTWRQEGNQPLPRAGSWPATIADRIYLVGGVHASGALSQELIVYNAVPLVSNPVVDECETVFLTPTSMPESTPTISPSPEPTPTLVTTRTPSELKCIYLPILFT
jgi:N-acetylneuraminic acid mutarotase